MLEVEVVNRKMVSVHDEPNPIRFFVPNVHPGEYYLPGVGMEPEEIARRCGMAIRPFGSEQSQQVCYAERRQNGVPYILLSVFEALTFSQTPAQQTHDEFGNRMQPDVQRVGLPVRAEQVVNEIERTYGTMGILAIKGEEPTEREINEAVNRNLAWKVAIVREVNRYQNTPLAQVMVTEQARRVAWDLHKRGRLSPLPAWATVNPEAKAEDIFHCICGNALRKGAVVCPTCRAIHDWRQAVEYGLVKPSDVPPAKRAEAGLEAAPVPTGPGPDATEQDSEITA